MCILLGLTRETDHTLDDTVSILSSGEDSGWFVDCDVSLSSSYLDNDKLSKPHKGENESDTEFSDSGKGWVPIWGEITVPEHDFGDEDDAGDGYNDVQTIDNVKLCFNSGFQNWN